MEYDLTKVKTIVKDLEKSIKDKTKLYGMVEHGMAVHRVFNINKNLLFNFNNTDYEILKYIERYYSLRKKYPSTSFAQEDEINSLLIDANKFYRNPKNKYEYYVPTIELELFDYELYTISFLKKINNIFNTLLKKKFQSIIVKELTQEHRSILNNKLDDYDKLQYLIDLCKTTDNYKRICNKYQIIRSMDLFYMNILKYINKKIKSMDDINKIVEYNINLFIDLSIDLIYDKFIDNRQKFDIIMDFYTSIFNKENISEENIGKLAIMNVITSLSLFNSEPVENDFPEFKIDYPISDNLSKSSKELLLRVIDVYNEYINKRLKTLANEYGETSDDIDEICESKNPSVLTLCKNFSDNFETADKFYDKHINYKLRLNTPDTTIHTIVFLHNVYEKLLCKKPEIGGMELLNLLNIHYSLKDKFTYNDKLKEYIKSCKNKFIILYISIFTHTSNHSNILIYNPRKKEIEIFEPSSDANIIKLADINELITDIFPEGTKYILQENYITVAFQAEQESEELCTRSDTGQCQTWTSWYAYERLKFPDLGAKEAFDVIVNIMDDEEARHGSKTAFINDFTKKVLNYLPNTSQ